MAQNTNAVQQIAMLKAELDRVQAQAAANLEGWQRTYAELQRSESDVAAVAETLQQARGDVERARTEGDVAIVRARKLEAELVQYKAAGSVDPEVVRELEQARAELAALKSELATNKTELAEAKADAKTQTEALATARLDIEALQTVPSADPADLEKVKAEAAANLDGWQRTRAEFANFKKRTEAAASEIRQYATAGLITKMLPAQDDLERAIKNLPENLKGEVWVEGVLLISRKIGLVFEAEGVKPIETKQGDVFDPTLQEAVTHDEVPEVESGHVIEELQRGYKIGERVLRPAMVRVAK